MHMGLRDMLISYMRMDLRWFLGYKTHGFMIYLFLNKLREREYLIQAEIALKNGMIYIFKREI